MRGHQKRIFKIKIMFSYQQERKWLEEQSEKGLFLSDIFMKIIYTFVKGEPKRMCYDIERFNLSKRPTLKEIRHKELFWEMAQEMGWREVTHDENLTYYFAKEYERNGVNELCNDGESRRYRAEKFRSHFAQNAKRLCFWSMIVVIVDILEKSLELVEKDLLIAWYDWFTLFYVVLTNGTAMAAWRLAERHYRELSMTRQEWEESVNPMRHRTVRKLILTNRGMKRFLAKQAAEGWRLSGVTPTRYFFEQSDAENLIYAMDSKWLVNKRREAQNENKIGDGKDWYGMNNDWELQSVRDAGEKGWSFVCALENRGIIYKGVEGQVKPLNDGKYDNSLRLISLIGQYGALLILCGALGGICGFFIGMFWQ